MNPSARPSPNRIKTMVEAASRATGVSVHDIGFRRYRAAVEARHGIWRQLRSLGFGYSAIGESWGVDHTTIHWAINNSTTVPHDRIAA